MRDLRGFREAVRGHRRAVGRDQQQLARSIGLHPHVLSRKLNGRADAVLTVPEVVGIATTLADWGALATQADVHALLDLMDIPPHAVPDAAWAAPPLSALCADEHAAAPRRALAPRAAAQPTAAADGAGILPGWAAAGPDGAATRPRLAAAPVPAPVTELIGRESQRAAVAAALTASRLVTLTGAGGTGKTRLALQAARDLADGFADGVAFADLAPVSDPAMLATTVARALGLQPRSAEAAEGDLAEALRDRELLLVLDNLEQLLEAAGLLARMLAAAPELRLLATSRVPLSLYGEHTLRVPPLQLPSRGAGPAARNSEAVRLFLARAQAVQPGFTPDAGELTAIAAICTAVDGLPLAIELAAAKVRLYPPAALLPQLGSRLTLLTGGPRDVPERQQTLRATLDWSHDLLPSGTQRLFARLGAFAGPFDAAAAAAVSGGQDSQGEAETLEQLADLADQGMLEVAAGQAPSFRMLQTVREYALARLAETGEQDDAQHKHLAYFLAVAVAAAPGLQGAGQAALFDRLEAAYPNIRAALEYACHRSERDGMCLDEGLRLASAVSLVWQRRGPLAEGVLQFDRLLALDKAQQRASAPQIRAPAVLAACKLACFNCDYARTTQLAREALVICQSLGDHQGLARAHRFLGEAALATGDAVAAEPHFERELAEASQTGDVRAQATAYNMLGLAVGHQGDFRRANFLLWRSVKLFQAASDPDGVGAALNSLAEVARDAGQPVRARRLFGAALRRHAAVGDRRCIAYDLEGFAAVAALEHAGRHALVYLGAAQALRDETGNPLPPAEHAILARILAPALAPLAAHDREDALREGRTQALPAVIAQALSGQGRILPASSASSYVGKPSVSPR